MGLINLKLNARQSTSQCPEEGGPGVIIARNLLEAIDSSVIYDDNMLCNSSRIGQILPQVLDRSYKNIAVYPNPSIGLFNIVVSKELADQNIAFSVYDLSGNRLYSMESKTSTRNIILDLSGFAPGMYYLRVQTAYNDYYQKLIVIK